LTGTAATSSRKAANCSLTISVGPSLKLVVPDLDLQLVGVHHRSSHIEQPMYH
jgi:hypothetical protein